MAGTQTTFSVAKVKTPNRNRRSGFWVQGLPGPLRQGPPGPWQLDSWTRRLARGPGRLVAQFRDFGGFRFSAPRAPRAKGPPGQGPPRPRGPRPGLGGPDPRARQGPLPGPGGPFWAKGRQGLFWPRAPRGPRAKGQGPPCLSQGPSRPRAPSGPRPSRAKGRAKAQGPGPSRPRAKGPPVCDQEPRGGHLGPGPSSQAFGRDPNKTPKLPPTKGSRAKGPPHQHPCRESHQPPTSAKSHQKASFTSKGPLKKGDPRMPVPAMKNAISW